MPSTYDAGRCLARRADRLGQHATGLPRLFAFTDPERTPDPAGLAAGLPEGAGLVLRTFGRPELQAVAATMADTARARGLCFLIAGEPELAEACGAHGVHWPQARLGQAALWRGRFAVMSASAHEPAAARRAVGLADLVFVSTVFTSDSPSAGRPMGPFRLGAYARRTPIPVYGLGGVTHANVRRLYGLGVSGIAAVSEFLT